MKGTFSWSERSFNPRISSHGVFKPAIFSAQHRRNSDLPTHHSELRLHPLALSPQNLLLPSHFHHPLLLIIIALVAACSAPDSECNLYFKRLFPYFFSLSHLLHLLSPVVFLCSCLPFFLHPSREEERGSLYLLHPIFIGASSSSSIEANHHLASQIKPSEKKSQRRRRRRSVTTLCV